MRGEQTLLYDLFGTIMGSPPLARGTVILGMNLSSIRRITPACAGNRKKNGDSGEPLKDHPRLRGEQFEFYIQVL